MKPKKPTKRAPKPKVYSVTFKVRTDVTKAVVQNRANLAASWLCDDVASLTMKPRVEEVGTR